MIGLILFLLAGALLFLSMFWMARSAKPSAPQKARSGPLAAAAPPKPIVQSTVRAEGRPDLVGACEALGILQHGLLPPQIVARVFSRDDFNYVAANAPAAVRQLFLRERKKIALAWAGQVRRRIVSLRRYHLRAARHHAGLSARTELKLAWDFAILLFACRGVELLVFLAGPYAAPQLVEATAAVAARVCSVSEKSLGLLAPGRGYLGTPILG